MLTRDRLKGEWILLLRRSLTRKSVTEYFSKDRRIFDGRLIILKRWSENIGVERELLSTVPVWIRFPSLHLVRRG